MIDGDDSPQDEAGRGHLPHLQPRFLRARTTIVYFSNLGREHNGCSSSPTPRHPSCCSVAQPSSPAPSNKSPSRCPPGWTRPKGTSTARSSPKINSSKAATTMPAIQSALGMNLSPTGNRCRQFSSGISSIIRRGAVSPLHRGDAVPRTYWIATGRRLGRVPPPNAGRPAVGLLRPCGRGRR